MLIFIQYVSLTLQGNLSNTDTFGAEESVLIREGCPVLPSSVPKNLFSALDYTFPVVPLWRIVY